MYSQKTWGGPVEPFILIDLVKSAPEGTSDPLIGLIIYEWKDEDLIGVLPSPDATEASPLDPFSWRELILNRL